MVSRTSSSNQVALQNPSFGVSVGSSGGGSVSDQSSFTGIDNPEALGMLMSYLQEQLGGGTTEERAMRGERMKQITSTRGTLGDYTKGAAFSDAAGLIAQSLRQSMEKNMPVINKAIQGAGTSASSMQALLSQKLATESAQAASALGAEQAKSYGSISTGLQSVLEALTRADPSNGNILAQLFGALKNSRSSGSSTTNPTIPGFSIQGGGGQSLVSPQVGGVTAASPYQDGVWYGPPTSGDSNYVPVGTPRSYYPDGNLPYAAPYSESSSFNIGSGIKQGVSANDIYSQASQIDDWATSFDW